MNATLLLLLSALTLVTGSQLLAEPGSGSIRIRCGKRGYVPHQRPRACYAGMVARLDREVGRIMALLKELGLDDDTLVIFSSDNGPTYAGGSDAGFFQSAGRLRGLKGSVWEGGAGTVYRPLARQDRAGQPERTYLRILGFPADLCRTAAREAA